MFNLTRKLYTVLCLKAFFFLLFDFGFLCSRSPVCSAINRVALDSLTWQNAYAHFIHIAYMS